jgi:hypothetical protein
MRHVDQAEKKWKLSDKKQNVVHNAVVAIVDHTLHNVVRKVDHHDEARRNERQD